MSYLSDCLVAASLLGMVLRGLDGSRLWSQESVSEDGIHVHGVLEIRQNFQPTIEDICSDPAIDVHIARCHSNIVDHDLES